MLFDLMWISSLLTGGGQTAANVSQITKASRASKLGARTARLIRIIRLIRILRLYKTVSKRLAKVSTKTQNINVRTSDKQITIKSNQI
jgi:hypothetical protein